MFRLGDLKDYLELEELYTRDFLKKRFVLGIGLGLKRVGGHILDEDPCLQVFVEKKVPEHELKDKDIIPRNLEDGLLTDVCEIGKITAPPSAKSEKNSEIKEQDVWELPARPGVSIGHYNITAGTLGAILKMKYSGELVICSNNHVLANSNEASIGDDIYYPGPSDGGKEIGYVIGYLKDFESLVFEKERDSFLETLLKKIGIEVDTEKLLYRLLGKRKKDFNEIDAAIATPMRPAEDYVSPEIPEIGELKGVNVDPALGMKIRKVGKMTGCTEGEIQSLNATVRVDYGKRVGLFKNQIITENMAEGGDSGSTAWDESNRCVGLLFAGSAFSTIYNPICKVLERFECELVV